MNKMKIGMLLSLAFAITAFSVLKWSDAGVAKVDDNSRLKAKLKKPDIVDLVFVAYNNWNYVMRNTGSYFYDSPDADGNGNNAGGEFPRGSGNTIVYAGGLYIGTLKNNIPVVSECEFTSEFQPGRITNSGVAFADLEGEDPAGASQKVYLIDRSRSGDYNIWPADAPKDDLGQPALVADAQSWAVFNDLNISRSQEGPTVSPDPGLGVQIVLESYAFNAGPLSDVVYLKFTIENKTGVDYADSYLGIWQDADVDPNHSTNDIVGVDTAKGLGFVYNADNTDDIPAAVGLDFLQGPVVKSAEVPVSVATKFAGNKTVLVYDGSRNIYVPTTLPADEIWLGATSFNTYANGTDPRNNEERYNLLAGRFADGNPKTGAGASDYYAFRGNPITAPPGDPNVGIPPGADQRILHGVGPFVIKAGSSQQIWVGIVGALGTDRLNAVSNMFSTDDLAQATFEAGLVAPAPPEIPNINVIALDGRVSITWQDNSEYSEDIAGEILGIDEGSGYNVDDTNSPDLDHDGNPDGFTSYVKRDFQGYRVYKSRTGLPGSFTQLAQYDKVDNFATVRNWRINAAGRLVIEDVVLGTNNGLRHSFEDTDVINGQRYYYSVTAYDAQPYISNTNLPFNDPDVGTVDGPSGLPISLETAPTANVTSVVPMAAIVSTRFDASADPTATHTAGVSDGSVVLTVVDPEKVTGHDYRVEFFELFTADGYADNTLAYRLVDVTNGNSVVRFSSRVDDPETASDERFFSTTISDGSENQNEFAVADGLLIQVFGPPLVVKNWGYTAGSGTGVRWFTGVNFGFEQFFGGLTTSLNFQGATTLPNDGYKDVDIVFSSDPSGWQLSYGHVGFGGAQNETFLVPFSVYEVDPTDGDATPRQVNIMIRDQNNLNGWFLDNGIGGDGSGPQTRSYIYITNRDYDAGAQDPQIWGLAPAATPAMFAMDFQTRNADGTAWNDLAKAAVAGGSDGGTTITVAERASIYSQIPDDGTFHILANHVITTADEFEFSTSANSQIVSKSELKKSLKNILVVPNPYYGRSTYQASLFDKVVKFTNLPGNCTIKIFTVSGDLVTTINHNAGSTNDRTNTTPLDLTSSGASKETSVERWDLRNPGGKFVASGMYVALIEAPGIGKTTVKFAVIQEEIQINGPDIR